MLLVVVAMLGFRHSFEAEMQLALRGSRLTGTTFHRALHVVGRNHGRHIAPDTPPFHTLGDSRGVVVWYGSFMSKELVFIWPEAGKNRAQLLGAPDGMGYLIGEFYWKGARLIGAGDGFSGGNWSWPAIYVFRKDGARWKESQILSAEDESTWGTSFAKSSGRVSPHHVRAEVRVHPKNLRSCHACPQLNYSLEWKLKDGRFAQTLRQRIPTALAALDDIAGMVKEKQSGEFNKRVSRSVRTKLWSALFEPYEHGDEPGVEDVTQLTNDLARSFLINRKWIVSLSCTAGAWRVTSLKRFDDHFESSTD